MTTIKAQADAIAATLNAAERGDYIAGKFGAVLEAARQLEKFTFGIVMNDKVIKIEMSWETVRTTTQAGLSEFIFRQMTEAKDTIQ